MEDAARSGGDQVEVVQQPFGCGRDNLPLFYVVAQYGIDFGQHSSVGLELTQVLAASASTPSSNRV
jgi:hypothetical protein